MWKWIGRISIASVFTISVAVLSGSYGAGVKMTKAENRLTNCEERVKDIGNTYKIHEEYQKEDMKSIKDFVQKNFEDMNKKIDILAAENQRSHESILKQLIVRKTTMFIDSNDFLAKD